MGEVLLISAVVLATRIVVYFDPKSTEVNCRIGAS